MQITEKETQLPEVVHTRMLQGLEEEDEANPIEAKEALPGTPEDPAPTVIVAGCWAP